MPTTQLKKLLVGPQKLLVMRMLTFVGPNDLMFSVMLTTMWTVATANLARAVMRHRK